MGSATSDFFYPTYIFGFLGQFIILFQTDFYDELIKYIPKSNFLMVHTKVVLWK